MRSGSIITIVLMVGLVFAIFTSIMIDFQSQYANDIDNSSYTGFYNDEYTNQINDSATDLQDALENIGSESNFFTKIGAGVVAISKAILILPKIIILSLVNAGKIIIEAQNVFGLPAPVMIFINIGLIIAVIFSLVNWWHSETPV